jgi:glycosyltransferase involved in cell wall biosynthesis
MRIAQVAPLFEAIPPARYGGVERVVSTLTDELVRRGHDVVLFASGDSRTEATLVPVTEHALWRTINQQPNSKLARYQTLAMLSDVYRRADEFDVIHAHTDVYTLPFAGLTDRPTVLTLHGRLDLPDLAWLFTRLDSASLVSVSEAQRAPLAGLPLNWAGCVPNGIPMDTYAFWPEAGSYLVFLGRLAREKRPDLAVAVARATGLPLKIAGVVHSVDREYWHGEVEPMMAGADVEYVGEVDDRQKAKLLGGALATLFPSDWLEPFGLVLAESLACGTPVVALDRGAVREIVRDGVDGFVCADGAAMVEAVRSIARIDRATCRERALRFSGGRLAEDYEKVYLALSAR